MSGRYLLLLLSSFAVVIMGGCAKPDITGDAKTAYQAYAEGKYLDACNRFEVLTKEVPKDTDLWFRMGNACTRAGLPKKGIDAYENALLRDPTLDKAWYNMGIVQMQMALNSFIEMDKYTQEESAARIHGREMRDGLLHLLNEQGDQTKQEEQ